MGGLMSEIKTYILYYIVILVPVLIVFASTLIKEEKLKFGIFLTATVLLVIVGGLRVNTGTDFISYTNIYYSVAATNSLLQFIIDSRIEPGWLILNYIVGFIFNDVQYVFIVSTLLICIFGSIAIYRHRENISLPIAMLILITTMFFPSFNTIRQYLAMSILLMSIQPLINRHRIKFIITVLIATMFHYMAIIFLFVYWLVNSKSVKWQKRKNIIVIISSIVLLYYSPELVSYFSRFNFFSYYSRYELERDLGIGILLLRFPVLIIILFNYKKLRKSTDLYKLTTVYFVSLIILNIGNFGDFVGRLGRFYELVEILLMASVIRVQKGKYERFLLTSTIVIYYLFIFTYNYIYKHRDGIIPYDSILFFM